MKTAPLARKLRNHSPFLRWALTPTAAVLLLFAGAREGRATDTLLAMRCETNAVYIHNGLTGQTIETNFGTNLMALPFTNANTTTYDFFSPPLASVINLTTATKAGGQVCLYNAAPKGGSDFSAMADMRYYDYNPATGVDSLLVDTSNSPPHDVKANQSVNFPLPNQFLLANYALPAGHLLHVAVIVTLTTGNPGNLGQLVYNGPNGSTTFADFPQNAAVNFTWPLNPGPMAPPTIVSLSVLGDPVAQVHCSGTPGATYLLQATTNLCIASAWTTIGTNVADTNGLFTFMDADATNYSCRFYRASTP
jgi:hypothetical protein